MQAVRLIDPDWLVESEVDVWVAEKSTT